MAHLQGKTGRGREGRGLHPRPVQIIYDRLPNENLKAGLAVDKTFWVVCSYLLPVPTCNANALQTEVFYHQLPLRRLYNGMEPNTERL